MSRLNAALLAAALALASPSIRAAQDQVYTPGDGVSLPTLVKQVQPKYTQTGMQLGIQGDVILSVVVLADGAVGDVSVDKSLDVDSGLDQAAVDAMKQWEFRPGMKDGKAVATQIHCQIRFALK